MPLFDRFLQLSRRMRTAVILMVSAVWMLLLIPHCLLAQGFHSTISGYGKTLNFFTRTSGFVPEIVADSLARREEDEDVFNSLNRFRLKTRFVYDVNETSRVQLKIDYDQQAYFGSFVSTGDFRIARNSVEQRQFLDLSQTLVEKENAFYEHRFYRLSISYENELFLAEIGRQQIPWGVGHFFTPTDLFNPFNPMQIELDERDGVDAVNLITQKTPGFNSQLVYTPSGKDLHPQRYLARFSKDIKGYETGLIGGRIDRDHAFGLDLSGNAGDFAVRGEFLYREAQLEKDFVKFTVNADYNLPHNIYTLVEYHFNGQGKSKTSAYQRARMIEGEIQQLSKNYLGWLVGYDVTPLIRLENRSIFNMNDQSVFERPEVQLEVRNDFLVTAGAQFYLGANDGEYGQPKNLYLLEGKYSF